MTQNAIFASDKSYIDRVMRRLIPLMSIVIILFALLAMRSVDASAQQNLRNEHEQGLARVSGQIIDDLALYISNSQSLARDPSLVRFINATSLGVGQATLRASDLIALHSDEYLAIRHIDTSGHIRLEITNRNGIAESFVPTEDEAPFSPFTNNRAFRQALTSNDVIPVVSGFRLQRTGTSDPTSKILLDIFTPIIPTSQSTPVGVVHLEIDAENLLSAVRLAQTNLVREQTNRRLILLDANDRIIADGSNGTVGEA